jgi:hypothetical protein
MKSAVLWLAGQGFSVERIPGRKAYIAAHPDGRRFSFALLPAAPAVDRDTEVLRQVQYQVERCR